MNNAFEFEVQFSFKGRPVKAKAIVGGIVIVGAVVIILCLTGHPIASLPISGLSLAGLVGGLWKRFFGK